MIQLITEYNRKKSCFYRVTKIIGKKKTRINRAFLIVLYKYAYFTASTTALKASGLFIAKSAKTLRFKPISLLVNLPIKTE
jgi:hypothetical protein